MIDAAGYHYGPDSELGHHHAYLMSAIIGVLERVRPTRIFDLGCGNGSVAAFLAGKGYDVVGVDPSENGITTARRAHPQLRLELGSAYDDLAARYGTFPAVISLEVIEHVYAPRSYVRTLFSLVEPGGTAVVSTPYHGYLKNLALALSGKMDAHFTALWDHGHIKFWSVDTLTQLLREAGFCDIAFIRVGRIPALAKSMIAVARKPAAQSVLGQSAAPPTTLLRLPGHAARDSASK